MKNKNMLVILIIYAFLLIHCNMHTISDFEGGIFKIKPKDGLYELDIDLKNEDNNGNQIFGIADIDSDAKNDLITISDTQDAIYIYLFDDNEFKFNQKIDKFTNIVSVIPIDINYDGKTDLLVTVQTNGGMNQFNFLLNNQVNDKYFLNDEDTDLIIIAQLSEVQATIVDLEGDHHSQLLIQNEKQERKVLSLERQDTIGQQYQITIKDFSDYLVQSTDQDYCLDYNTVADKPIANPHFNAFIDINGDCQTDLFIVSEKDQKFYFEFYLMQSDGKYCLKQMESVENLISATFSDLNSNGSNDFIFIREIDQKYYLNTIENLRELSSGSLCSTSTEKYSKNPYDFKNINENKQDFLNKESATTKLFSYSEFKKSQSNYLPAQIRIQDFNHDRYPDMLLTVYDTNLGISSAKSLLFANKDCDGESFCKSIDRKFSMEDNDYNIIKKYNSVWGTFMDISEKGSLDIILTTLDANEKTKFIAIYNFLNTDAFFLKATSTNGNNENGAIYYGATFQCAITALDAQQNTAAGSQLFSASYNSLQLPYIVIGLGRTNNYVEDFHVGMPQTNVHTKSWTPIIPNSQLFITPKTQDIDKWSIKIVVNPTKATIIIVLSTILFLMILGSIILYLHKKEKEEDKQTQNAFSELFR